MQKRWWLRWLPVFLDHYDSALFTLLLPFISLRFFCHKDPLLALLYAYGVMNLNIFMKPLGAIFFGWFGDKNGRSWAATLSCYGLALCMILVSIIPTYAQVGWLSGLLFAVVRAVHMFMASGASSSLALFLIKGGGQNKSGISSLFDALGTAGYLVASFSLTLVYAAGPWADWVWRILCWMGASVALAGRYMTSEHEEVEVSRSELPLKGSWRRFWTIFFAAGFNYANFAIAFTFFHSFLPLWFPKEKLFLSSYSSWLLLLDLCFVFFWGQIALRWGPRRTMLLGSITMACAVAPFFYYLPQLSLLSVLFMRVLFVFVASAFAAPYYAWIAILLPEKSRGLIWGMSHTLGSQLVGAISPTVCLLLYKITGHFVVSAFYLAACALIATMLILLPPPISSKAADA